MIQESLYFILYGKLELANGAYPWIRVGDDGLAIIVACTGER